MFFWGLEGRMGMRMRIEPVTCGFTQATELLTWRFNEATFYHCVKVSTTINYF